MIQIGKSVAHQVRTAAQATAADRERPVDLVRAGAIGAIVLGHWSAIAIIEADGTISGINALRELRWAHPLTWLFQVMPLFFFIGGYANAASLAAHERRGGDALGWVLGRYERVLRPTSVLLAVLVVAVGVARLGGIDHDVAATGAWLATVPMWFLLIYLAVLALSPLALAAHRAWGLAVPLALVAVVGMGDLARLGLDLSWVGGINYFAAWAAVHQVGFAWWDGRLPARAAFGVPLAAVALAALFTLTMLGPYPVSMVGVPGEDVQNTAPPTLALMALAAVQIGVTLTLRDRASSWLQQSRPWLIVVAVNSAILTIFLWHMAAAITAAVVLYATGILPVVPVGSAEWLVLRIPWLGVCLVVLAGLVALFAPIELKVPASRKGAKTGGGAVPGLVLAGVVSVLGGMLGIAAAGSGEHGPLGLPTWALMVYALGAALLVRAGRRVTA